MKFATIALLFGVAAAAEESSSSGSSTTTTTTTTTTTITKYKSFTEKFASVKRWQHKPINNRPKIPTQNLVETIAFYRAYQRYRDMKRKLRSEYEALGSTWMIKIVELERIIKLAQQKVRDCNTELEGYKVRLNDAETRKASLKIEFQRMETEITQELIRLEQKQTRILTEYRATWFNGMSDQQIYEIVAGVSSGLDIPMDPWTESSGKCVDQQYFQVPGQDLIIDDGDRFIGRTQCHQRCKANLECVAFHAENNSLDTGECVMLRDGPSTYIGDGPRDPNWHCHVDKERDTDDTVTVGNDDKMMLLDMLEEMELMLV